MSTNMPDLSQFKFGQRLADDFPPNAGGDQWIRGFRDPSTQVRIVPAVGRNRDGKRITGYKAWPKEREHYDHYLKISYPCIEEYGGTEPEGMGCHHPDERVRKRPQKWYFNALDREGELHIYKIGVNLWEMFRVFQDNEMGEDPSNDQPLSARDYHILKSGADLQTKYFAQGGNAYDVDFSAVKPHDIGEAIATSIKEAFAMYSGDNPLSGDEDDDIEDWATTVAKRGESPQGGRIAPKGSTPSAAKPDEPPAKATKKVATKKATAAAPEPESTNGSHEGMTADGLQDMELPDLRAWVSEHAPAGYELAPNMSRSRLTKVGAAIIEGDDIPF